jgi:hypothetical protein
MQMIFEFFVCTHIIVFKTKKGDLQYYVVALCSHEVESIGTVFINDDVSTDKKFKDHLHIEKMTGSRALILGLAISLKP